MSIYKNSIHAFIQVLDSQANLISRQDWNELQQLPSQLPEDDEKISEVIENWLKPESRNQLFPAYKQNLESISAENPTDLDINLGMGNTKSSTPPNEPSPSSKELLDNAIKRNSPLSDDKNSQPKP